MTSKVLVLGGYGLIGSACMRALSEAGFNVTGLGRSAQAMRGANITWIQRDITTLTVEDWSTLLKGFDVVVNASGALQDGARDSLTSIHVGAINALCSAAATLPLRLIQISAAGVSVDASTAFLRTKAQGDALIMDHLTNWVILRPTLVLSPDAYGGTALLRGAAALPLVLPRALPDSQIQTVHVDDVAHAVLAAASGDIPSGTIADLTESQSHTLPDLLTAIRKWQGWPDAIWRPTLPNWMVSVTGRGADLLGHLGWRSPLRSTALHVLHDGVTGDSAPWLAVNGPPCRSLNDTLSSILPTRQDRLFSRLYFALPAAIALLSLFWILSGLITLINPARALEILTTRHTPQTLAAFTVLGGALADILLGALILWRPAARHAALGMIALSGAYLVGSVLVAPDLWADPLGPMVKVLPGIGLAAMVWLTLEDR